MAWHNTFGHLKHNNHILRYADASNVGAFAPTTYAPRTSAITPYAA